MRWEGVGGGGAGGLQLARSININQTSKCKQDQHQQLESISRDFRFKIFGKRNISGENEAMRAKTTISGKIHPMQKHWIKSEKRLQLITRGEGTVAVAAVAVVAALFAAVVAVVAIVAAVVTAGCSSMPRAWIATGLKCYSCNREWLRWMIS